MYLPARADDKRVFWGFVRVAFVIAAVLLWSDEHDKVTQLSKQPAQAKVEVNNNVPPPEVILTPAPPDHPKDSIFLDCDETGLPIEIGADRKVYLFDALAPEGLSVIQVPASTGNYYPPPDDLTYRCQFVNYGDDPLFSVRGAFGVRKTILSKDTEKESYTCGVGGQFDSHVLDIPEIDPHSGRFSFTLINGSDECAEFSLPTEVTLETGSSRKRTSLIVRRSSAMQSRLFLFPRGHWKRILAEAH